MHRTMILLLTAISLQAGLARADDTAPDCENPQTQADMNSCAAMDADKADAALNLQYKKTKAAAVAFDKQMEGGTGASAVATLTRAQKAWIPYRDATCDIQTAISGGGSIEATLVAGCLETETRKRTAELKQLEQDFQQ